jgi:hypothetical protein
VKMEDKDIDQQVLSCLQSLPRYSSQPWRSRTYVTSAQRSGDGIDYTLTIELKDFGTNTHPDGRFSCEATSSFGTGASGNVAPTPEVALMLLFLHQATWEREPGGRN